VTPKPAALMASRSPARLFWPAASVNCLKLPPTTNFTVPLLETGVAVELAYPIAEVSEAAAATEVILVIE
jgi:hypothetical protein